ncbi:MAG: DoxX family protein [Cyclobacteriaceae bacterium]|nr:DoxX family protein [Cyclobacteriaceae bacterium]
MKPMLIIKWLLRVIAALIMLQTLYFKFTAQPESVQLFGMLGMEPWGRIGTGVGELIASLLILFPPTSWIGAGLGLGLMSGAIFFHLTILGVFFGGDALLFSYAVIVFVASGILLYLDKEKLIDFVTILLPKMKK